MVKTSRSMLMLVVVMTVMVCIGCGPASTTLYAQSLPANLKATWTPNPASQNVTQYKLTLDGGTPQVAPLTSCTPTLCTAGFVVPTYGSHTVAVVATNVSLDAGGNVALQDSPPAQITFTLNTPPNAVGGLAVKP